jgi:siroheme synthase (precorrin-2 oxidase/ferrochelatase)
VSAGGSPAVAVAIRDDLRARWDHRWTRLAEASASLRPLILAAPLDADARRAALRDLTSPEAVTVLEKGSGPDLLVWLCERYPNLTRDP